MIAIGLGKAEGAREAHRWFRKYGFEPVIRSMSEKVPASGKILCGLALIENEFHQIAEVRASLPDGIIAQEEASLTGCKTNVAGSPTDSSHLCTRSDPGIGRKCHRGST
jgi:hypothetical protein